MRTIQLAIMIAALNVYPSFGQTDLVAQFKTQIAILDSKSSNEDRLAALKWIQNHKAAKQSLDAVSILEKLVVNDSVPEVRESAVIALALICNQHKRPCPAVVIKAIRDKDEGVRSMAGAVAGLFRSELLVERVDLLLEACEDERPDVRSTCVTLIAHAAPKDSRVLAAIEKGKADKAFEVRLNAHCAKHTVSNDLNEFLTYMVRIRAEPEKMLDPLPTDSEAGKTQQCRCNLFVLSSAMSVASWSEDRPEELAKALLSLLDSKSAPIRREAIDLIGAAARHVDGGGGLPSPFSILLPFLDPDGKFGQEPPKKLAERPMPSKAYSAFQLLKLESRLRSMMTTDSDPAVREAAKQTLNRLAELPELLRVRPREVKP